MCLAVQPSWRTHSIITRVGPGGEHSFPEKRIVRSSQPVPSATSREGPRHVKGGFSLGLSTTLWGPPSRTTL